MPGGFLFGFLFRPLEWPWFQQGNNHHGKYHYGTIVDLLDEVEDSSSLALGASTTATDSEDSLRIDLSLKSLVAFLSPTFLFGDFFLVGDLGIIKQQQQRN